MTFSVLNSSCSSDLSKKSSDFVINPDEKQGLRGAVVDSLDVLLYCFAIVNFIKSAVMPFATATLKNSGAIDRFPYVGERWRWRV